MFGPRTLCSPQQNVSEAMPNRDINHGDKMGQVPGGTGACSRSPNSYEPDEKLTPHCGSCPGAVTQHTASLKGTESEETAGKKGGRSEHSVGCYYSWLIKVKEKQVPGTKYILTFPHGPFFIFVPQRSIFTHIFLITSQWNFNTTNKLYIYVWTIWISVLYTIKKLDFFALLPRTHFHHFGGDMCGLHATESPLSLGDPINQWCP